MFVFLFLLFWFQQKFIGAQFRGLVGERGNNYSRATKPILLHIN